MRGELQTVRDLIQSGRFETAIERTRAALKSAPQDGEMLGLLGAALEASGRSTEAVETLRQARTLVPNSPIVLANLGTALLSVDENQEAAELYREINRLIPNQPQVLANYSAALERIGVTPEALAALQGAVHLGSRAGLQIPANWRLRLGRLLHRSYRYNEAENVLRQAIADAPDDVEGRTLLGLIFEITGREAEAQRYHAAAFRRAPDDPTLILNFVNIDARIGRAERALNTLIDALKRRLDEDLGVWPQEKNDALNIAMSRLSNELGVEPVIAVLDHLLRLDPENIDLLFQRALSRQNLEQHEDALSGFKEVLEKDPEYINAYFGVAYAAAALYRHDESREAYLSILKIDRGNAAALSGLIHSFSLSRKFDEANTWARRALIDTDDRNVFFGASLMVFVGTCDYEMLDEAGDVLELVEKGSEAGKSASLLALLPFAETAEDTKCLMRVTRSMVSRFEVSGKTLDELPPLQPHPTPPDGTADSVVESPLPRRHRPVRVGLLSGDLRNHSVGRFVRPLIETYDRERLEFFCYSSFPGEKDSTAEVIAGRTELYERVTSLSDTELVTRMRDDHLDIAFDLSGVTMFTRMLALVNRAAPVQVEWLGYPFTTGFRSIDYFLVDRFLSPTDPTLLVEKPLIMDRSWITIGWLSETPVNPEPPCKRSGYVTFGTLNNAYKYSRKSVALWSEVLHRVPNSRFIVIRPEASSVIFRANLVSEFKRNGIEANRIEFFNNWLNDLKFDECYNHFDISLDTFPLTGGTTTVDCLDMGVPVVSLAGPAMHQRISHAILHGTGLGELSTDSEAGYVETAVALASDPDRIAAYRATMRDRLRTSNLCNAQSYADDFATTMERVAHQHGLIERMPDPSH